MTSSSDSAAAATTKREKAGATASTRTARAGEVIAERYVVERQIGRGGMGVVYRAQHLLTARPVALKLLAQTANGGERALNEARSAASLCHPNVVAVLDVGVHDGRPFLVMELLSGEVLSADTPGARDISQLLRWMLPILGAVAGLHEQGYVHGDLKPANVLLHRQGTHVAPKLIDFGLASALFDRGVVTSTVYGTPRYMAPERAAGAELSVQADVWSLGMILLECLAGRSAAPGFLAGLRPDLPKPLVLAIERAVQVEPQLRFVTVRALARSLLEACCLAGIDLPDDPDPLGLPEFPSWRRQNRGHTSSETHSVEAERATPTRPRKSALLWTVPALLGLGALIGWASWSSSFDVVAVPARAPRVRTHQAAHAPPLRAPPSRDSKAEARNALPITGAIPETPRIKPTLKRKRPDVQASEPEGDDDDYIAGEWR